MTIAYSGDRQQASWQTGYEDAGSYTVHVTCTSAASGLFASQDVHISIKDKNRPPVITAMVVAG